jgi:hypothetical protein
MNIKQFIYVLVLCFIILIVLAKIVPIAMAGTTSSFDNLPPYSSYTYTFTNNTTVGTANSSLLATRTINIAEASNSDIVKTELLNVTVDNTGAGDIIANITFNGVFKNNLTATAGTNSTYINIPVTCLDGVNTVVVGTYSGGTNVSYRSSILKCATTLNGTDYTAIVDIVFVILMIGGFLILFFIIKHFWNFK